MTGRTTRFTRWLAASMENAGLTKREFGIKIGMDASNVTHWIKGRAVPSTPTLTKIAQEFGVEPVRLLVTARPDEFPEEVYGPPLPVPKSMADERRANELLDELAQLTGKIREGDEHVDSHALTALETIRALIRGDEKP